MEIRKAALGDAKRLITLIQLIDESEVMLFEPGERLISSQQMETRIERSVQQNSSTILIAEHEEKLVGYLFLIGNNPERAKHTGYIYFGVSEEMRRMGVATKLFQDMEKCARECELHRLELTVLASNEAALSLYEQNGFKIEGTKRDSLLINGEYQDELYMSKLI